MLQNLKRAVVRLLGRETANRIAAPYHDWRARGRTRRTLLALPAKDLRINIGCGSRPLPGWVNLDAARGDKIDVVWDLRRGLPFPDSSCSAVFSEHFIEHVTKEDAARFLSECYRVLKAGGVLRVSTRTLNCSYVRIPVTRSFWRTHPFLRRLIHRWIALTT